jgi:hypothetical protein
MAVKKYTKDLLPLIERCGRMNLNKTHTALVLGVHLDTFRAWLTEKDAVIDAYGKGQGAGLLESAAALHSMANSQEFPALTKFVAKARLGMDDVITPEILVPVVPNITIEFGE